MKTSRFFCGFVLSILIVLTACDSSPHVPAALSSQTMEQMQLHYTQLQELYGEENTVSLQFPEGCDTNAECVRFYLQASMELSGSADRNERVELLLSKAAEEKRDLTDEETALAEQTIFQTEAYIARFDVEEKAAAGMDIYSDAWDPERIGKPLEEIDFVYDYDFALLEEKTLQLQYVDRRRALAMIFRQMTAGAKSETEKQICITDLLNEIEVNDGEKVLQAMYPDKRMVCDPLLLLELQEMRCGQVARIATDLYRAAGYDARLVQGNGHVWAEVFYEDDWHYLDADMYIVAEGPWTIGGRIPSTRELLETPEAWKMGRSNAFAFFPNYITDYYFGAAVESGVLTYYVKTATLEEEINSDLYGWNHYETVEEPLDSIPDMENYDRPIPDPPRWEEVTLGQDGTVFLDWSTNEDEIEEPRYRVIVLPQSRGWDTLTFEGDKNTEQFWAGNSYRPEMYSIMGSFDWEKAQILRTTQSEAELTLDPGKQYWVSVQALDEYAEAKGILFCPTSSELALKIPA